MSHISVDEQMETLQDDVQMVARMIQEGRYEDAFHYLEYHVVGGAEQLMDEIEEAEGWLDEY